MTIRRFLYPSLFIALAPPVVVVPPQPQGGTGEPFVSFTSTVIADSPVVPVQPPAAPPSFSPSELPPRFIKGYPARLQQDGSDFVSFAPPAAAVSLPQSGSGEPFVTQYSVVVPDHPAVLTPPVVAVQPYGAFPQDPALLWKANYPAKLQQDGTDNAPAPFPFFSPPFAQSPERFAKGYPAKLAQDGSDFTSFGTPVAAVVYGAFPQYPDLFAKGFPVKLQWQGPDFPASGTIVSVTPQGFWTQLPALFAKPLPAAQQRFQDFVPLGTIVIPQYGAFPQYPDIFAKLFPVKLQWARDDFPASSIAVATPTTQGAYVQDPVLFVKPFPVSQQRFGDFASLGTIVSVTPQGWWGRWPDVFAKPFSVSLQQLIGFAPVGNLTATPQGWWGQSPVLFARPIPVSLQRFSSDFASTSIAVATPGWQFQWPDLFCQSFAVKLQWQGNDFPAQGTIVSTTPQGWMFQSPERFIKPLPAAQQRFPDYATAGFIAVTPPFILTPYFQYPERFIRPLSAAQQRFPDFTPLGTIVSTTPQGWMFQPPALFAKPLLGAYLQRFSDAAPRSYAFTAAIFTQWPERFWKASYPAKLQQRGEAILFTPVVTPATLGAYFQWPERFIKRLPAAQQRFQDFAPRGTIVSVTSQGWMHQQPVRFAKSFPVYLQQFEGLAPQKITPPAAPTISGVNSVQPFIVMTSQLSGAFSGWTPFAPPFFAPPGEGEMLKNEVERTRWLAGNVRVRWVLNDIIRRRDLN